MGTYFLPQVGDEVLVAFERGDQEHPFVIGSLWNGKAPAPEDNGDGNNDRRLIRSRSGHELRFDDNGSAPEVELKLQDGKHLKLDRNGVTVEDERGNSLTIESASGAMTIKSTGSLTLAVATDQRRGGGVPVAERRGRDQHPGRHRADQLRDLEPWASPRLE